MFKSLILLQKKTKTNAVLFLNRNIAFKTNLSSTNPSFLFSSLKKITTKQFGENTQKLKLAFFTKFDQFWFWLLVIITNKLMKTSGMLTKIRSLNFSFLKTRTSSTNKKT